MWDWFAVSTHDKWFLLHLTSLWVHHHTNGVRQLSLKPHGSWTNDTIDQAHTFEMVLADSLYWHDGCGHANWAIYPTDEHDPAVRVTPPTAKVRPTELTTTSGFYAGECNGMRYTTYMSTTSVYIHHQTTSFTSITINLLARPPFPFLYQYTGWTNTKPLLTRSTINTIQDEFYYHTRFGDDGESLFQR